MWTMSVWRLQAVGTQCNIFIFAYDTYCRGRILGLWKRFFHITERVKPGCLLFVTFRWFFPFLGLPLRRAYVSNFTSWTQDLWRRDSFYKPPSCSSPDLFKDKLLCGYSRTRDFLVLTYILICLDVVTRQLFSRCCAARQILLLSQCRLVKWSWIRSCKSITANHRGSWSTAMMHLLQLNKLQMCFDYSCEKRKMMWQLKSNIRPLKDFQWVLKPRSSCNAIRSSRHDMRSKWAHLYDLVNCYSFEIGMLDVTSSKARVESFWRKVVAADSFHSCTSTIKVSSLSKGSRWTWMACPRSTMSDRLLIISLPPLAWNKKVFIITIILTLTQIEGKKKE